MDRLTTGRRHARAGSVTVTELLVRQASPARCTDSSPVRPDDDVTETIPVVAPASHRRPRGTQFTKLATIGVAGAVLCGAVAVSSVIAQQRREDTEAAVRASAQITGDQALLPDRLDRSLPQAHVPAPAPQPLPRVPDDQATPGTTPPPAASAAPVVPQDGGTTASGDPGGAATGEVSDLELVRAFYGKLPGAPAEAFELLAPELVDSGFGEFLQSWSRVVAIDSVDLVQRADGVLATVRMRLLGGGHLRVQQLLTVAESPRRIVGAQLLSAQRN